MNETSEILQRLRAKLNAPEKAQIVYLSVDALFPHPDNPRKELGDLTELADSIKAKGIMQNLTVVKGHYLTLEEYIAMCKAEGVTKEVAKNMYSRENAYVDEGYTVIIGHRRMGASKLAGLKELPCVIVEMSAKDQVATMLLENMQRSDLTVFEQAQGFQMMFDFGESVESISKKTGFSQTTVRRRMKLAELDKKTLEKVSARQISFGDFDRLAKIEDAKERNKVLADIGTRNFENSLARALGEQTTKANIQRWREALLARGLTEISAAEKWDSSKYIALPYISLHEETESADELLSGEGPYFFCFDHGTLYLRGQKKMSSQEEAAELEQKKQEDEKRINRDGLVAAFKRAYELRKSFVSSLSDSSAKEHFAEIVCYLIEQGCHFNKDFDYETFAELSGAKIEENEYDEDVVCRALKDSVGGRNYFALLTYAYAISGDHAQNNTFTSQLKYKNNSSLNGIYAFLERLGYEKSDEERELMDGTSPLFAD